GPLGAIGGEQMSRVIIVLSFAAAVAFTWSLQVGTATAQTIPPSIQQGGTDAAIKERKNGCGSVTSVFSLAAAVASTCSLQVGTATAQTIPPSIQQGGTDAAIKERKNGW